VSDLFHLSLARRETVAHILIQRAILPPPLSLLRREHETFAESPVFETMFDEHPDNDSDFFSHVLFYTWSCPKYPQVSSMQCACAILSYAACLDVQYFPHYLINARFFRKKKSIEHKIGISNFSSTFISNIFRCKKNWATYNQKCLLGVM